MGYKIIRPRRGIKSLWDAYKDKIYKTGEMLVESPESGVGTGPVNVKFGDGMTPYYALPYAIEAPINQAIEGSTKPITSGAVYEQNKNLGGLRFGVDGDGNYGYYGADDSLIPFNSIGSLLQYNEILALYEYGDMGESATNTFTASEDMIVFVFGYVRSINYDQYINIETTGKVLNDKLSISKYSYSSGRFTAEVNLKSAFIKLKKGETITTSMYCFNYGQCHCYIIKCNS